MIDALKKLCPLELPEATWRALEQAYATPPRAYHTLEHVLDVAERWAAETWNAPRETFLAVLFHDAVYVVGRDDNEARSADLFESLCGKNQRVAHLIRLTAKHGRLTPADVDDDEAKFLDCDMAILGANKAAFERYQERIAEEYVPKFGIAGYRAGRADFFHRLLAKPRIFLSDAFHERLDARARDNLRRALK